MESRPRIHFFIFYMSTSSYKVRVPFSIFQFWIFRFRSGFGSKDWNFFDFMIYFDLSGPIPFFFLDKLFQMIYLVLAICYIHIKGYVRDSVYSAYISGVAYNSVTDAECSPEVFNTVEVIWTQPNQDDVDIYPPCISSDKNVQFELRFKQALHCSLLVTLRTLLC